MDRRAHKAANNTEKAQGTSLPVNTKLPIRFERAALDSQAI